ncbi:MAG: serine proteinase [Oscillospiraceae bacterium]
MNLDVLMGRVSELAQSGVSMVSELTQTGVAKAKEMTEIGKLKISNSNEEDAIRKAYTEIGRLYYAERGMAPESPYAALCEKVTASKEKIAYNSEKISDIKEANDIKDADLEDLIVEVPAEEPAPTPEEDPVPPEEPKE